MNILRNLTPANKEFYNDLTRFQVVTAGRRSRKTLIAMSKMLFDKGRGACFLPEHMYLFAAPTHAQAKQVFWNGLKSKTEGIQKKIYEGERKIILKNKSVLHCVGLDVPARIEGITDPPIKGILTTETDNVKDGAWENHIRPILSDNDGFAILEGVPEGIDFLYDKALLACNGSIPETIDMIGAHAYCGEWSYHSWFSSDILTPAEIESAKRDLDEKTFNQEYKGAFESFSGLAYYAYSSLNHSDIEYQKGFPVSVGMDFNVDPMCCTEGVIKNGVYYQFGESVLRHSNTYEMAEHLIDKYPDAEIHVYPDSTGKNTNSSTTTNDLKILQKYGFRVFARSSNPRQKARINVVNSCMRPMEGNPKYYLNPKNCPQTIWNFQKVERLADGRLNKKQEKEGKSLVHLSDGLGYLLYYNYNKDSRGQYV
jgi:hypothetical protein